MGILSRFSDIVSANINALLDKAEDPSKMIDQYLRNAMEDYAEVKKETAAVMAEERRCKRLVDDANEEIEKYTSLAKKALQAGNEGDARVFLTRKQEAESKLSSIQGAYDQAAANATKMRQMHDKLQNDIRTLQSRKEAIKATMAVAKTQDRINKANDAMSGANGSLAAFGRMEEKAQVMLDQAAAAAELSAGPEDPAEDLMKKYPGGGSVSVDEDLAKMKAEMGL